MEQPAGASARPHGASAPQLLGFVQESWHCAALGEPDERRPAFLFAPQSAMASAQPSVVHWPVPRAIMVARPMLRFFAERRKDPREPLGLGRLELGVMQIVWDQGECSVRDVVQRLERKLAYTTIMTTLDRLFKKGLLDRRKAERAFVYSPRLTRPQWEQRRAHNLLAGFLAGPKPARDLLLSCLLEAVEAHDPALLDELEKKIRAKRRELSQRGER